MAVIPYFLEKLIVQGKASYNIHNHAFSMYGKIPIKEGSTAIITNITWHNFINPIKDMQGNKITFKELFSYLEYQLKIDSKKAINYHIFRNQMEFQFTKSEYQFLMSDFCDMRELADKCIIQPKPPITLSTYQVCEEYIRLTISRNAKGWKVAQNYGILDNKADEQNSPNGVQDVNLIKTLTLNDVSSNKLNYTPVTNELVPNNLQAREVQNYYEDIYPQIGNYYNNQLTEMQDIEGNTLNLPPFNPYIMFPLVSIGYVLINKNIFDTLQNN